jgi:hypothetical protein
VGPSTIPEEVEKGKFLTLQGHEPRLLSRPVRSQSLYRPCYPGSYALNGTVVNYIIMHGGKFNFLPKLLFGSRSWKMKVKD